MKARRGHVLSGDIGATKISLGLWDVAPSFDGCEPATELYKARYASAAHGSLREVIERFLGDAGRPTAISAACLGVAGPIWGRRVVPPNLGWTIDADEAASAIGTERIELVNDLVATAEGIAALREGDFETLQAGDPLGSATSSRLVGVVAAGTGLGMAILVPTSEGSWQPFPSEGGHTGLAPRNEREIGLLRFLQRRFGRVSVERVVSGPGLVHLYEYVTEEQQMPRATHVEEALERERATTPAVISGCGLQRTCPACSAALDLFVRFFGAAAGDLALCLMATGGIFLAGGIAPKILSALRSGGFAEAFRDKGRHGPLLERIPVRVVRDEDAALLGAARRAARALQG